MCSFAGIVKKLEVISKDHIRSLKAGECIQKGELIGAAIGPIVASSKTRHVLKIIKPGKGRKTLIESQNAFKYIKTSVDPNVVFKNGLFYATKKIRKNTPITIQG